MRILISGHADAHAHTGYSIAHGVFISDQDWPRLDLVHSQVHPTRARAATVSPPPSTSRRFIQPLPSVGRRVPSFVLPAPIACGKRAATALLVVSLSRSVGVGLEPSPLPHTVDALSPLRQSRSCRSAVRLLPKLWNHLKRLESPPIVLLSPTLLALPTADTAEAT